MEKSNQICSNPQISDSTKDTQTQHHDYLSLRYEGIIDGQYKIEESISKEKDEGKLFKQVYKVSGRNRDDEKYIAKVYSLYESEVFLREA